MSREPVSFGPREGMASYYGREFNGRKTSSGERFDMHKFTAAHRELPFGTMVKVTNLANGKSVVVRVNDRGPFKRDRIIDLSFAAGKAIRMTGTGTARVRIEIIK
jgi:rare lipoprotein A